MLPHPLSTLPFRHVHLTSLPLLLLPSRVTDTVHGALSQQAGEVLF